MAAIRQPASTRLRGGYSCQFVEELATDLQAECSICLQTVREPHLVDCCGYRFCKTCIEPLLSSKRCPLCNGHFSTVIQDKLLQRTLNQKQVYCTRKSEGCLWTGELAKIEEHELNCPRKPVMCDLCKEFQAPQKELKEHQKNSCPARLIECPNGCGGSIKLSNIKTHHKNKCPLSIVICEFAYAGCLSMMHRKDVKNHLEVAKQAHIVLLSGKVKEMEVEMDRLKLENAAKDMKIRMLTASCKPVAKKSAAQSQSTTKVLVMNFPSEGDNHMSLIKSVFGQYGRVKNVKYTKKKNAIVEYIESKSVSRALERHYSTGITVLGTKLDIRPHT